MSNVITIQLETYVDLGNFGVNIKETQSQQMLISLFTETGIFKSAAPSYQMNARSTDVMYVSGVVTTAGSLITVDRDGGIPPEYNGHLLTAGATIITPEIFLSAADLGEEITPPTPVPPNPDDGKPTTGKVLLLLKGDNDPIIDSSLQANTLTNINSHVTRDLVHKVFGAGSMNYPAVDGQFQGLSMEVRDTDFDFNNDSITIESRIRVDDATDSAHRLFSCGSTSDATRMLWWGDLTLSAAGVDNFRFNWKEADGTARFMNLPFTGHPFATKEWSQFIFVFDASRGRFGVFVDGVRVAYVDASVFTDPLWTGIYTASAIDGGHTDTVFVVGGYAYASTANEPTAKAFKGKFDEYRVTKGQALYDPASETCQVYDFAWPPPKSNPE